MNDNEELREQQKDAEIERLTADLAAANAALDELLACKQLSEDVKTPRPTGMTDHEFYEYEQARWAKEVDYSRRKPLAWEAARALRKGAT